MPTVDGKRRVPGYRVEWSCRRVRSPKLRHYAATAGMHLWDFVVQILRRGTRYIDARSGNNINVLLKRPDGKPGYYRITMDPEGSRVISAGMMRQSDVDRLIERGAFIPTQLR